MQITQLALVVPCYNEEGCIEPFLEAAWPVLDSVPRDALASARVVFVDDGSSDQ